MPEAAPDPKQRFTSRVTQYARYRPGYPKALLNFLAEGYGVAPSDVVADIGSGTGLLTRLFLENGNRVYGVEPNAAMREAAEALLAGYPAFRSIDGSAERTSLAPASIDLVSAGQAFHWFEPKSARAEFMRILKPRGTVALVWNSWVPEMSPFLADYGRLIQRYSIHAAKIDHRRTEESRIGPFFAPASFEQASFPNFQDLDLDGLQGRLTSSSYIIPADHPDYPRMIGVLREIFDRHERGGSVRMDYRTNLYVGRLN